MRIRAVLAILGLILTNGCGSAAPESIVDKPTLVVGVRSDLPLVGWQRDDGSLEGHVILASLAHQAGGAVPLLNARYSQERTGVGVRPGDVAGCEAVNRAITEMYQDGTAQRLAHTWFGASGIDLSTIAVPQFEGCS